MSLVSTCSESTQQHRTLCSWGGMVQNPESPAVAVCCNAGWLAAAQQLHRALSCANQIKSPVQRATSDGLLEARILGQAVCASAGTKHGQPASHRHAAPQPLQRLWLWYMSCRFLAPWQPWRLLQPAEVHRHTRWPLCMQDLGSSLAASVLHPHALELGAAEPGTCQVLPHPHALQSGGAEPGTCQVLPHPHALESGGQNQAPVRFCRMRTKVEAGSSLSMRHTSLEVSTELPSPPGSGAAGPGVLGWVLLGGPGVASSSSRCRGLGRCRLIWAALRLATVALASAGCLPAHVWLRLRSPGAYAVAC